jgi:oligoribonuclease (3'-5' exoribonuclease)
MKYISIDLEATGLEEHAYIIEFAAVPVDTEMMSIDTNNTYHSYIKCPTFKELKPELNEWVIKNNESLISKANSSGIEIFDFKNSLINYLKSDELKAYRNPKFNNFTILGKSLNSIDIPFLNRDLGWETMKNIFHHQVLDVSSVTRLAIDLKKIPKECSSGSYLSKYFGFGEVAHTALEDSIVTAKIYFKLLEILN